MRHGQSVWNKQNRFTGWVDVSLSQEGMAEATMTGKLLREMRFDLAFTSLLLRAQDTLYEILKQNLYCDQYMRIHETRSEWYEHFTSTQADLMELKIYLSEKLNERYYGDLQGKNKEAARKEFGDERVHLWRRSYDIPPPGGESLEMTALRVIPYYDTQIKPYLKKGASVLVSAHGNSLRALIMHLERLTPDQIQAYEWPTGSPHVYHFDSHGRLQHKNVLS
ncbi:phosphoglycerate mutase [Thiolapillus brandeum]|uniref:2,3-bisphosphoglycerate-dependent phosphoglycerate mutase n=1 Tax=Thiolapillus brandeum TaxID=1076588 RepID=A0A7U6JID3_9GAMM|nr:phosphoglycerate mutase [Thiolapillus brandeum]